MCVVAKSYQRVDKYALYVKRKAIKMKPAVEVTCMDCGRTFIAHTTAALRCEECKKIVAREATKKWNKKERAKYRQNKKVPKPVKSIQEILREMEAYNKENHTKLSYGDYVGLVERG